MTENKKEYVSYQTKDVPEILNPPDGGSNISRKKTGCPICGDTENLVPDGRCVYCRNCGWSKCSL